MGTVQNLETVSRLDCLFLYSINKSECKEISFLPTRKKVQTTKRKNK